MKGTRGGVYSSPSTIFEMPRSSAATLLRRTTVTLFPSLLSHEAAGINRRIPLTGIRWSGTPSKNSIR